MRKKNNVGSWIERTSTKTMYLVGYRIPSNTRCLIANRTTGELLGPFRRIPERLHPLVSILTSRPIDWIVSKNSGFVHVNRAVLVIVHCTCEYMREHPCYQIKFRTLYIFICKSRLTPNRTETSSRLVRSVQVLEIVAVKKEQTTSRVLNLHVVLKWKRARFLHFLRGYSSKYRQCFYRFSLRQFLSIGKPSLPSTRYVLQHLKDQLNSSTQNQCHVSPKQLLMYLSHSKRAKIHTGMDTTSRAFVTGRRYDGEKWFTHPIKFHFCLETSETETYLSRDKIFIRIPYV